MVQGTKEKGTLVDGEKQDERSVQLGKKRIAVLSPQRKGGIASKSFGSNKVYGLHGVQHAILQDTVKVVDTKEKKNRNTAKNREF